MGDKEMQKKGRPLGHKLSAETKSKISESKMGYIHTEKSKRKIRKAIIKYYKSPEGILHRERLSNSYRGFWNSDEGVDLRLRVGKGLSKYYKENLL